jgi:hypothetical protein
MFGSPCLQGEPKGGGLHLFPPSVRFPPLTRGEPISLVPPAFRGNLQEGVCTCFPPSVRFPPLREGNHAKHSLGSPCLQGEPAGGGSELIPPLTRAGEFTVSYKHPTPPTTQAGGAGALRKEGRKKSVPPSPKPQGRGDTGEG